MQINSGSGKLARPSSTCSVELIKTNLLNMTKLKRPDGLALTFLLMFVLYGDSVDGRRHHRSVPLPALSRPAPENAAPFARWLISQSSWGVLNTISSELGGAPFGNVASFSDGLPNKGSGIPYFYLSNIGTTVINAVKDPRSSFTVSEYPLGTCRNIDPENPMCAKITLTGKLKVLDGNSSEAKNAQTALFAKHPEMKSWPEDHTFQVYKLEIENIFMINWFGGAKLITVDQYLHAVMKAKEQIRCTHATSTRKNKTCAMVLLCSVLASAFSFYELCFKMGVYICSS